MPELPEVETVRRLLEHLVLGKRITQVDVYRPKNVLSGAQAFSKTIKDSSIEKIVRKGKLLGFCFDNGIVMTSHLRMEGKYYFQSFAEPQGKHDIFRFLFIDGSALVYNDVRKFGRVALYDKKNYLIKSDFSKLGEEPFSMSPNTLKSLLSRHKKPIKECLMDQSIVAGIGNIYCDETLFAARIHPLTPANEITLAQCQTILAECSSIMKTAIEEGGSTIRSYHPGKGIDGMMQLRLQAYGRELQPCPICGVPMRKIIVNQRGTTYCPKCQKSPRVPFVIGVTGPIHSGKSSAARYFASKGYLHFNADEVAKQAYLDRSCKAKILRLLGRDSYVDGVPCYATIREKLNRDSAWKTKLEAIIHPYVFDRAKKLIQRCNAAQRIVLDVPLLFQSGMDALCDVTILVLASEENKAKRLLEEGKDAKALLALNRSYPIESIRKKAGYVIINDADLDALYQKLDSLGLD